MTPQPTRSNRRGRSVAGIQFSTLRELHSHVRAILQRNLAEKPLAAEDENFMRALLQNHPHYAQKVGAGIDYIYVFPIPHTAHRRFEIQRLDGTKRDFAWQRCLEPPDAGRDLARVARHLIVGQTLRFRESRYQSLEGWNCEICGDLLIASNAVAIDHVAPWTFERLLADWLEHAGITAERIEIVASPAYLGPSRLGNPALAVSWQDYHQLHAQLRILCVPCHHKISAGQRRRLKEEKLNERTQDGSAQPGRRGRTVSAGG
jgi:hypothetical protein